MSCGVRHGTRRRAAAPAAAFRTHWISGNSRAHSRSCGSPSREVETPSEPTGILPQRRGGPAKNWRESCGLEHARTCGPTWSAERERTSWTGYARTCGEVRRAADLSGRCRWPTPAPAGRVGPVAARITCWRPGHPAPAGHRPELDAADDGGGHTPAPADASGAGQSSRQPPAIHSRMASRSVSHQTSASTPASRRVVREVAWSAVTTPLP